MKIIDHLLRSIEWLSRKSGRDTPIATGQPNNSLVRIEVTARDSPNSSFCKNVLDEIDGVVCGDCSKEVMGEVSRRLGRPLRYKDDRGFDREIFGALISPDRQSFAYVEARAKQRFQCVDIKIKIYFHDPSGRKRSVNIKTYNPYFGCIIHSFKWIDGRAILIYSEKHDTYICTFGDLWPPRFITIEDRWILNDGTVAYINDADCYVRRLSIPNLDVLEPITAEEAKRLGMYPEY